MRRYQRLDLNKVPLSPVVKVAYGILLFVAIVGLTFLILLAVAGTKYRPVDDADAVVSKPVVAEGQTPAVFDSQNVMLHQWLAMGTHNSYKKQPKIPLSRKFRYEHEPIVTQLRMGMSHFELDLHIAAGNDTSVRVFHLQLFDDATTCRTIYECVAPAAEWSREHNSSHSPIVFFLGYKTSFWESVRTYDVKVAAKQLESLENEIEKAWPFGIVRPTDVSVDKKMLLADANGKAIFVLRDGPSIASFNGKVLHIMTSTTAGALKSTTTLYNELPVPLSAADASAVASEIAKGKIVRARVDAPNKNPDTESDMKMAITAGIQMVVTDHPPVADADCCRQRKSLVRHSRPLRTASCKRLRQRNGYKDSPRRISSTIYFEDVKESQGARFWGAPHHGHTVLRGVPSRQSQRRHSARDGSRSSRSAGHHSNSAKGHGRSSVQDGRGGGRAAKGKRRRRDSNQRDGVNHCERRRKETAAPRPRHDERHFVN